MSKVRRLRLFSILIAMSCVVASFAGAAQSPPESGTFASISTGDDKITINLLPGAAEYSRIVLNLTVSANRGHQQAFTFLPGAALEVKVSDVSGVSAPQTSFRYELTLVPRAPATASAEAAGHDAAVTGQGGQATPAKRWAPITGALVVTIDGEGKAHFTDPGASESPR